MGRPEDALHALFKQAGKSKSPLPVRGTLNGKKFKQTLVKFRGAWRLYLNILMRQDGGIDVDDNATFEIEHDPEPRIVHIHPKFAGALLNNKVAKTAFENLLPSRQKEILRYLNSMKTDESFFRNVEKAIEYLSGKKPKGILALMRLKE